MSSAASASDLYHNEQAARGAVHEEVPESVRDLSLVHKLMGCLATEVTSPGEWAGCQLSPAQVELYWEQGFLSNVPVLTEQQCDQLLQDYRLFLDADKRHPGHGLFYEFHHNQGGCDDNVLLHALGQWRITPAFHDVCFLPKIAVPSSQLVDPSHKPRAVRLWHDQLFAKPPRHGGVVAWHQDYSYWTRTKPMLHVTVHVALDDQTVETGGLHYVPGSHRWHRGGMPLPITDDTFGDMQSIEDVLTAEEKSGFRPVSAELKRGEASFHHPLMVHGSYANKSDRPRRACVVNYVADGVWSDSAEPLMNGLPAIEKGGKLEGQFFPLVYDPSWGI